jgi:hypothetical protein
MSKKAILFLVLFAVMALGFIWMIHPSEPKTIPHAATGDWACLNNLRLIDSAKQLWAEEHHKTASDSPTWDDMRVYCGHGSNGELPECTLHGVYTLGRVGDKTRCSIHGTVPDP